MGNNTFCYIIVCLIGADVGNMTTRITRFANYLRNQLPSNDVSCMELVAKTMANLALASGPKASQYVEFEVKKALEWLNSDRVEVTSKVNWGIFYFTLLYENTNFSQKDMLLFWF